MTSTAAALMPVTAVPSTRTGALTQAMARGDSEAFRQFHTEYFDRLLRYQFVLARGDEQTAREALQETLTRVAWRVKRFDNEEVFWSWLTTLARSAAIDQGRRRQRYWRMLKRYALGFFEQSIQTPDQDAEERLGDLLEASLATLGRAERELLEAKYVSRASYHQLARDLGTTEKAVESRVLRVRRKVRRQIENLLRHEQT